MNTAVTVTRLTPASAGPGTFTHLLGGQLTPAVAIAGDFAHLLGGQLKEQQIAPSCLAPSLQKDEAAAPLAMTTAETAAAIIAAGEVARGSGNPRRTGERIADMMSRSRIYRMPVSASEIVGPIKLHNEFTI